MLVPASLAAMCSPLCSSGIWLHRHIATRRATLLQAPFPFCWWTWQRRGQPWKPCTESGWSTPLASVPGWQRSGSWLLALDCSVRENLTFQPIWGLRHDILSLFVTTDKACSLLSEMGREASSSPKQSVRSVSSEAGEMVTCLLQLLLLLAYDCVQKLHSGQVFTASA